MKKITLLLTVISFAAMLTLNFWLLVMPVYAASCEVTCGSGQTAFTLECEGSISCSVKAGVSCSQTSEELSCTKECSGGEEAECEEDLIE